MGRNHGDLPVARATDKSQGSIRRHQPEHVWDARRPGSRRTAATRNAACPALLRSPTLRNRESSRTDQPAIGTSLCCGSLETHGHLIIRSAKEFSTGPVLLHPAPLLEEKRYGGTPALPEDVQHPFPFHRPGFATRLAPDDHPM